MKRILLAGILGGVVLFVWGAISWMALPWHDKTMKSFTDDAAAQEALREQLHGSGVYFFPSWPANHADEAACAAFEEAYRKGPVGLLAVRAVGGEVMPPVTFVKGFLINLLAALLVAFLLSRAAGGCPSWGSRVLFVALVGLIIGIEADGLSWTWMNFPGDYTAVMILDRLAGWTLAGMAMSCVVRS